MGIYMARYLSLLDLLTSGCTSQGAGVLPPPFLDLGHPQAPAPSSSDVAGGGEQRGSSHSGAPLGHTRLPTGPRSSPCKSHVLGKPGGRPCMSPAPLLPAGPPFQPGPPHHLLRSPGLPGGGSQRHNTSCPRACRTGREEAQSGHLHVPRGAGGHSPLSAGPSDWQALGRPTPGSQDPQAFQLLSGRAQGFSAEGSWDHRAASVLRDSHGLAQGSVSASEPTPQAH